MKNNEKSNLVDEIEYLYKVFRRNYEKFYKHRIEMKFCMFQEFIRLCNILPAKFK